jgi:hypothetical protein
MARLCGESHFPEQLSFRILPSSLGARRGFAQAPEVRTSPKRHFTARVAETAEGAQRRDSEALRPLRVLGVAAVKRI